MKKLMYILLFLLIAANAAAQESYVIDSVCLGSDRLYRIDTKEKGSTWEWYLKDTLGNEIDRPAGTDFTIVNSPGDTVWGSEINIIWNDLGVYDILTLHYSSHGCDTLEQGRVKVYPLPEAFAGIDMVVCVSSVFQLTTDTAANYSSLLWTTLGDGIFDDDSQLNPLYTPGAGDSIAGSATLVLTAYGLSGNGTCTPVIDSIEIRFGNPVITLSSANLLCYNDSTGWIKATVTGGMEPYIYSWTGPGVFTSSLDSIFGLAAGKYLLTVTDNIGCVVSDSVEITEPLELLAPVTADTTQMCDDGIISLKADPAGGTGSYTHLWTGNGAVYLGATDTTSVFFAGALAGIYTLIYNVTDENGCVAADTIDVTVLPKDTIVVDTVICGLDAPFAWKGKDYFFTGQYTDTLESLVACDTILLLDLTVLPIDTLKIDTVICDNEIPLALFGINYFVSGIYTDTIVSATGCDSILVLNLDILPRDTITLDTTICGLDAPLAWYGEDYFVTGNYTDTLFSPYGCDTTLLLNLVVLPIDTLTDIRLICANNLPYTWHGKNYFETNIYVDTLVSATGCDSILVLDLTVMPIDTLTFDEIICGIDAPYEFYGKEYFSSGIFIDTLVPVGSGCDTILILNLTVLPIDTVTVDTIICITDTPFALNGRNYNITGIYTDTIVAATGCDSILILDLTVMPIDTITIDTTICGNEVPFALFGKEYFTTDIYTDTLPALIGCDTIVMLNLIVHPIDTVTIDTTICGLDAPFAWNGLDFYTSGVFIDTVSPPVGCDTILILDLTILPIDTLFIDTMMCANELPFAFNGKNYYDTDIYTDTIWSATGCDSIFILELMVLPVDTTAFDTIICGLDAPYAWNGNDYFDTGIYLDTLVASTGCDSILILDLTVLPIDTLTVDTVICDNETPFAINGKDYFFTGNYIDTIVSATACDSILVLNLTVMPRDTITLDTTICGLDAPLAWYGKDYFTTDIYVDTLPSVYGCDTILILDLTVLPIDTILIDTVICASDLPFARNGIHYYDTDIYMDTLVSATGCDSIFILDLTVIPMDTVRFDTIICGLDAPFAWNGNDYFTTGIYMDTLTASNGCDSILVLDLTVLPIDTLKVDTVICENETPFTVNGKNYFDTGIFTDTLISATGCDSIFILDLTVMPIDTIKLDTVICEIETPFVWNGNNLYTTGIYVDTLPSPFGCDTTLILNLTVLPNDTIRIDTVICENEVPFEWNGYQYYETNVYTNVLASATGCDSLLIVNLQILPNFRDTISATVCESELPYTLYGEVFNTADTIVILVPSVSGSCDSIFTVELQTLPEIADTLRLTVCESELPYTWMGQTFNTADRVVINITSVTTGCDTIRILELQSVPAILLTENLTICETELPYTWFGYTFDFADTVDISIPSVTSGCDTILTLQLLTTPEIMDTLRITVCESELPYNWMGHTFNSADTIVFNVTTVTTGCDTTRTLELQTVPVIPVTKQLTVCETELPYTWNGYTFITADTVDISIPSVTAGCDTILTLELQTVPEIMDTLRLTVCESELPYTWAGHIFNTTDTIVFSVTSVTTGCDTTRTLELQTVPEIPVTEQLTLCENELPYTWFGHTFITADTVVINVASVTGGCDTLLTLQLQIVPELVVDVSIIADNLVVDEGQPVTFTAKPFNEGTIPQYRWFVNNMEVAGAILDNYTYVPNDGDEVYVILVSDLTCAVNNPATSNILTITVNEVAPTPAMILDTIAICIQDLPVTWKGKEYFAEGTYRDSLIIASRLDSIFQLTLIFIPEIKPEFDQLGPYCQFAAGISLPTVSKEGIIGKWTQDTISTNIIGVQLVTFTPDYGQCATSVTMEIEVTNNITPAIDGMGPFCENSIAPPLPAVSINNVRGTWSPSFINTQLVGNRTYRFMPDAGQCSDTVEIDIEVIPLVIPTFNSIGALCQNSVAPLLPALSNNGITGTWSPAVIDTKDVGTFNYNFTPDTGQCAVIVTITVDVIPEITPTFVQIGPLCQNSPAPALPTISTEGRMGTWSPAIINTNDAGLFTYTFTPLIGQCAEPTTMIIEIIPEITPVFMPMGPFCRNSVAPLLPLVSTNGISGTWNPAIISTAVIGIFDYTFTPDPGECAVDTTIKIEITDKVNPLFAVIGPFCQYSVAPALPSVSLNGFTGTWFPDSILTNIAGTNSFLFTPDDPCANAFILDVVILPEITPAFVHLGPLCQYSSAPMLQPVSTNGVTGTWSPDSIDTSVDGTFTYTFTPDSGQCSVPVTMDIEILPEITPVFVQLGPLCQNGPAPILPLVSTNGIPGTWNPSVIDTKVDGIFIFIFTPNSGFCAIPDTMIIEVTPEITPVFVQLGPLCQNSVAPVLPAVSTNGISGTWSSATIDTKTGGTFTFTFTPAPVHCAVPVTMSILVTTEITPVFEAFGTLCPNSIAPVLPLVSENGISGTWNPAIIKTDKQGIFTFTFTPDSGLCAAKVTVDIEISDIIPPAAISRNITVYLDEDGKASVTTAQINNGSNDNCELDTLYLSRYDFGCDDIGKNPVILTAVDGVGLIGTTEATVTVLDTISPVVLCRGPFEIQLDENAEYKLTVVEVLESVSDNCGAIDTMYVFPHELDCDHIGLTIITLMVVDVNGNSSYCETEVMIYGNRPPTVLDDSTKTIENVAVVIDVISNDYDEKTTIDPSSLRISIKPLHGVVTINPVNGDLTYTPNYNFSGVDVLQYSICDDGIPCEPECGQAYVFIIVEPVNDKPFAIDDYYSAGCFSVSGNILDNDTDPDSDNLLLNTNPLYPTTHGELTIDPDGTINYYPNDGFIGIDSFAYVICDSGKPSLCDTATVYIDVDCSQENPDPIECELFIPEGFSPNEDGIHDFFRIMCIDHYPDAKLMIFNRNGDLLWEKEHYGNYDVWGDQYNAWWWGTSVLSKYDVGKQTINGDPKLKVGNYVYVLLLGNGQEKNGTVMVAY